MNYYEDGFPFFGMRDYVPHTYNQFRTARDRANKIINSQVFYINTPLEGDYTDEELAAFNESIKAYDKIPRIRAQSARSNRLMRSICLNLPANV